MLNSQRHSIFLDIASALVILLWTYTGASKLMNRWSFQVMLMKSPLLAGYAEFVSFALPIAELLLAILLIIPNTKKRGFQVSLVLLSIMTAYLGYMVLFAPSLPCSCGGVIQQLTWRQHILFNLFFIGLAAIGWRLSMDRIIAINPSWAESSRAAGRKSRTPV